MSRRHVVVLWRDGDYTLTDLSTNGTWLQYGQSGVVVRVHRSAAVLRAAGALYLGRAPRAGQPPDVRFVVERPGHVASQDDTTPQSWSVPGVARRSADQRRDAPDRVQP